MTIEIAKKEDASRLIILLAQLGYTAQTEDVIKKINLHAIENYKLMVAKVNGEVMGFIALHVYQTFHLSGLVGRITSFCVDESQRGFGIGNSLLAAAEDYFKENKCYKIEVTSNLRRTSTHSYYLNRGYQETSKHFVKFL